MFFMEIEREGTEDLLNDAKKRHLYELKRQQVLQAQSVERGKIQQYAADNNISLEEAEQRYRAWLEGQIAAHNAACQGNEFQLMERQDVVPPGTNIPIDDMYYIIASQIIPNNNQSFLPQVSAQRPQYPLPSFQTQMEVEMSPSEMSQMCHIPTAEGDMYNQGGMLYGGHMEGMENKAMVDVSHQSVVMAQTSGAVSGNAMTDSVTSYATGQAPMCLGAQGSIFTEEQINMARQISCLNYMQQYAVSQMASQDEQQRLMMLSNPAYTMIEPAHLVHLPHANGDGLPMQPMLQANFPKKLPLTAKVVREGYLMKRGEHIRNWRRRYFVLREDGTFFGFKSKPKNFLASPLNNFTVRNCKIKIYNKPKPFCFALQGLQWTTVVHRLFFVESERERREWITSIKMVADRLKSSDGDSNEEVIIEPSDGQPPEENEKRKSTRVKMEDFDLIKVLGKGTFGKVILCRMKDSGQMYAMKLLKKSVLIEKEEIAHTYTECRVLRSLEHPFMTKMRYSFTTPVYLCFVMEYVNGGELFYHLNKAKRFPEDTARFYGAELTSALGYMHNFGIIYRDLKLENILLDQYGHIKIADFGLCKEEVFNGESTKTFCGTPEYLAPEVLRENDYDKSVDWWGLGVVMFEMLCGRLPFYSKDHEVLFELILNENIVTPPFLSNAARDLLLHLLIRDPHRRLGGGEHDALEVMAHMFFMPIEWEKLIRRELTPPWKPDVRDAYDTKYIPDEFVNETVHLTPPTESMVSSPDDVEPYFRSFSFHGSRQSLIYGADSIASTSHTDLHMAIGSSIQE